MNNKYRSFSAWLLVFSAIVFSMFFSSNSVFAATLLSDDFTGTTINSAQWFEKDSLGLGGSVGNIQQNGSSTLTGAGAWGANYLSTLASYNRNGGGLELEADALCGAGNSIFGIGYGDPGVLTGGGQSYTVYSLSNRIYLSRQSSNSNAENVASTFSCVNGVPFHLRLAIGTTTGATLYINGSSIPAATVTGGTFTNKGFFLSGHSGVVSKVDNVIISALNPATIPDAPTGLSATAGNSQVSLSWTSAVNNGSALIDYVLEYKLTSDSVWTSFNDGTSTLTSVIISGLLNGSSYDFRVSAVNSIGTSPLSNVVSATPTPPAMEDTFTGTVIDTAKWVEVDAGGLGGSVGKVQQNDSLSILSGVQTWATQNGIRTVNTFDRADGDVSMEFLVSRTACGTGIAVAAGYGDMNFTTAGSASYIFLANGSSWQLYYWNNGSNQGGSPQNLSGISSCTNGVPVNFKLVAKENGGASVYVNGASSPSATIAGGTFTNKPFWIGSGTSAGGTSTYDGVVIREPAVGPLAPIGLAGTVGDGEVDLTWTSGGDNGLVITDYVVEYAVATSSTWSVFSDGISSTTSATVTGLANATQYGFRVAAVNSAGVSDYSSVIYRTPVSSVPTAPVASVVSILGTASVGETLAGSYVFADANGDAEAISEYRWLRSDTVDGTYVAISGATSTSYLITAGDLAKYLKFEVTPIANVSPTTGTVVTSAATAAVNEVDYVNQILSTGQSLSVGVASTPVLTTTQPYNNLMLEGGAGGIGSGTTLVPLVEATVETMSSSLANTITANETGNDFDVAVSLHGVSGYTYSQLKKGTSPYNKAITQVTNTKNAAIGLGRVSRVLGVTSIHGETDNYNGVTGSTYQGYLEEWQNDYETDVKAITGQSGTIPLFVDQMSSFMSSYANDATSEIPIYQLKASVDNPGEIVLVAPKYFFTYSDRHHLTGSSTRWLGEYYGKVIKQVAVDHQSWKPLSPENVTRSGNVIYADFHVPAGELVFDTTLVSARTNMGFEYYDSTSSATIADVEIIDADTVKITLSGVPTGTNQRLRYAYTGVPGTNTGAQNAGSAAGNLRDTDPYPSLYGNTLYNWAVHFDEPIN